MWIRGTLGIGGLGDKKGRFSTSFCPRGHEKSGARRRVYNQMMGYNTREGGRYRSCVMLMLLAHSENRSEGAVYLRIKCEIAVVWRETGGVGIGGGGRCHVLTPSPVVGVISLIYK